MFRNLSRHTASEEDRSVAVQRRLILLGFAMTLFFVIWAAFTPLHEMVSGQGLIQPAGKVARIQHLEGGMVADLQAAEGDEVAAGDVIMRLDASALQVTANRLESRRSALDFELQRELALASGKTEAAALVGASGLRASQQAALDVELDYRASRLAVLDAETALAQAELSRLAASEGSLRQELVITTRKFDDYDRVHQTSGAISRAARDQSELDKIRIEGDLIALQENQAAAQLKLARAREARADFLVGLREEALSRAATLEASRAEVDEELSGVMATIGRTVITAPVSGRIQSLSVRNAFQVIAPGELVAEIVPRNADLIAEIEVGAAEVGAIVPGMQANVKILTYDFVRFGGVAAVVESISPTSAVNEHGDTVFKLKLSLASGSVGGAAAGRVIRPGYSVIADIRTGRKTILTYLLKPVRVIADKALTES